MEITEQNIQSFLEKQQLAVVSTVGKDGLPDAAPIYYTQNDTNQFLFIAPEETTKIKNINQQNQVALTVVDQKTKETAEIKGTAKLDVSQLNTVLYKLAKKLNTELEVVSTLPLLKFKDQRKTVVVVEPKQIIYRRYTDEKLLEKVINY